MELEEAKQIVRLLAEGIDPTTGEVLPKESPYNNPVIIRALFAVLESLKEKPKPKKAIEQKQQDNLDSGRPRNAGLPWTDELKTEISSKFQNGTSVPELSRYFKRTKGAIVSELTRQGLIDTDEESDDS